LKLKDIEDEIYIDSRKLTHYALNDNSLHGKHKAIVFKQMFNYDTHNYNHLMIQLQSKALDQEVCFHSEDYYGKRYTVDVEIKGINDTKGIVRTGWFVPHNKKLLD